MIADKEYIRAWEERVGEVTAHLKFDDTYLKQENLFKEFEKAFSGCDVFDKTIIDVGCGGGLFAEWVYTKTPVQYIGFDISERAIKESHSKFLNKNNFIFMLTTPTKVLKCIKEQSADYLVCLSVIQHIPAKEYLDKFLRAINNSDYKKLILQIRHSDKTEFRDEPYKTTHDIALSCKTNASYLIGKLKKYTLANKSDIAESGYQYLQFEKK